MTSFLSSNIVPAINGFFDWMNVLCNQLTVGGAQMYFYSTDNKTLAARNLLQVGNHGNTLEWISNDGVVHTLANSTNPSLSKNFFTSFMILGTVQPIVIPMPPISTLIDPQLPTAVSLKNEWSKIAGDKLQYTGAPNRAFLVNITGTASTMGGGGTEHQMNVSFEKQPTIICQSDFTCIDTTQQVNFSLSGFFIANTWDTYELYVYCNAPLTVGIQDLSVNITEF